MAQFDVHVSPGRNRTVVPYVVDVQSRRYEGLLSRLVVPLLAAPPRQSGLDPALAPAFVIEGRQVFLNPFELQAVRRALLGPPVASLADDASSLQIVAAIDLVITRAYG